MDDIAAQQTTLEALREALDSGTLRQVRRQVNALHPAEIANLLESLPLPQREIIWELVAPEDEGDVLVQVNDEVRSGLIDGMAAEELIAAAASLDMDDLADLLLGLPETLNQQIIRSLDSADRQRLAAVLAYDEDSAGGLMNTDTVTIRPDVTVEVVLRYLRIRGDIPEATDAIFVVNRSGRYLGYLYLARLLTADVETNITDLMRTEAPAINATTPASEVASLFENYDLVSAAVVNDDGMLLGRITVDDVVDVIREQGEHSLMSMAGLDEDDDMFAPVFLSARRRALWLGVNLATAFLAARVVGLFEATLDKVVVLAVLMPVVASMGGIAGSQTLTLMVRGMALGQVERSNAGWLLAKETAVGALNGLLWALVVSLITFAWFRTWEVGAIIAAALAINLLFAALAGVTVPLLLRRLGVDPALAGGVVLTTVTDVVGFGAFLGLGALFLT
jgi:magnesium transporter